MTKIHLIFSSFASDSAFADHCERLQVINTKKLHFIHYVNGDGSKIAKIIKTVI